MQSIRRAWRTTGSILACVLALAGASFVAPSGSAGAAAPSGTPIKIGYIQQQQAGPSAINEEPVLAAWAKWVNAHGGIAGHPVQIVFDVEPGNVAVAVTDVQKLIADGVVAIVDADANDSAWAQYTESAGVPVLLSTNTLAFGSTDDAVGTAGAPIASAQEGMMAAKKVGANKLALLYCTEFSQCKQAVPFYQSLGKKFGVDIVYNAAVSGSAPNYTAQCLAAKEAGANSLFVASTSATTIRIVGNCAKQGFSPHVLAAAGSYQKSFAGTAGMNGMIATAPNVPFFDTNVPAIKQMTDGLNKYNPSITKSIYYDDTAVQNWSNGIIVQQAAKAAHWMPSTHITPTALRNALFALHTTNGGGLMTPITLTKGQPETNNCYYTVSIKNNKFVLPHGLTASCIPAS